MTDTNRQDQPSDPKSSTEPSRHKRRWMFAGGLGLLAAIAGVWTTRAWANPGGFGRFGRVDSAEELRERIGRGAEFALWKVDATEAQRKRVEEILDRAAPQLFTTMQKGKELRQSVMEAVMSGDRGAAESNRKQALAWADEASKLWLSTLEQALAVLSPEQRTKVREHMQHFGGRRHGRHHGH